MVIGICTKCKQKRKVLQHHTKGYKDNNDFTLPYCYSCHKQIHNAARKTGQCNLTSKQMHVASTRSCMRRTIKIYTLSCDTVSLYVALFEQLVFNTNTGHIRVDSYFHGNKGRKIYYI